MLILSAIVHTLVGDILPLLSGYVDNIILQSLDVASRVRRGHSYVLLQVGSIVLVVLVLIQIEAPVLLLVFEVETVGGRVVHVLLV